MATDLDAEQVLMDPDHGHYYGLNSTAKFLFSEVEEPMEVRELINRVTARYGIPREQAAADVEQFLREMERYELVRIEPRQP